MHQKFHQRAIQLNKCLLNIITCQLLFLALNTGQKQNPYPHGVRSGRAEQRQTQYHQVVLRAAGKSDQNKGTVSGVLL